MSIVATTLLFALVQTTAGVGIDRQALVARHTAHLDEFDPLSPVQVGNGEFAFGMDLTGLQTFTPFNTLSQWGWHSSPPPAGQFPEDFQGQTWEVNGRSIRYPMPDPDRPGLSHWLASNPHRINLGRIGLLLSKSDGSPVLPSDLRKPSQVLDLWSGVVTSRFEFEGQPVMVKTASHPNRDAVAVQMFSPLIRRGQLAIQISSPGDDPRYFADYVGDWTQPASLVKETESNGATLTRKLNDTETVMRLRWSGNDSLTANTSVPGPLRIHDARYGAADKWLDVTEIVRGKIQDDRLELRVNSELGADPAPGLGKVLKVTYSYGGVGQLVAVRENEVVRLTPGSEASRYLLRADPKTWSQFFTVEFLPGVSAKETPSPQSVFDASRRGRPAFWKSGGAIDLSASTDPRWRELERRIVLSQYLLAVNGAGSVPSQESGLVNNGWYGRFHLEMVWWHQAHWALWNRWGLLNKSIGLYDRLLPVATRTAEEQGYRGARWPKAIGPDGREWPHEIHALLAWQQPHPIFFAELDYRAHPSRATLEKWWPIVEATADFMASYPVHQDGKYDLAPPIHVVSENTDPRKTRNPTFELGYWRYGLRIAEEWRKRTGHAPKPEWTQVLANLAPIPSQEGRYVLHEGIEDMWSRYNYEHPAIVGTFGMLPGDGIDPATMKRTLAKIGETWNFNRTWGWDFPMLAMSAARLGQPELAVDYLLHPSPGFQFDAKGLATGGPFPYFPSNGGLLYAVAMMAGGWDGAPLRNAPGFPSNGKWSVRHEGLAKAP